MISDLILIAKKFGVPSSFGRGDGVRDFFAQYPDGIYIEADTGAPAGWEGYAIWFGGAGERHAERFMEMLRVGYTVERLLRSRVGGVLVLTFRCRLKMRRFGTLGRPNVTPLDGWWGLKLAMANGGTVTLTRTGSPNVVNLEVSTDAVTWQPWTLVGNDYTYTLNAGETLCIRNTSAAVTAFSTSNDDYWTFAFSDVCAASGSVMSLVTINPLELSLAGMDYEFCRLFSGCSTLTSSPTFTATILAPFCYYGALYNCTSLVTVQSTLPALTVPEWAYRGMYRGDTSLVTAPAILATTLSDSACRDMFNGDTSLVKASTLMATTLADDCCRQMFYGCSALTVAPELFAATIPIRGYNSMFSGCSSLTKIRTHMTDISANLCLYNWLLNTGSNGDFYCDANLTIPSGVSGIPIGWTRHNI